MESSPLLIPSYQLVAIASLGLNVLSAKAAKEKTLFSRKLSRGLEMVTVALGLPVPPHSTYGCLDPLSDI